MLFLMLFFPSLADELAGFEESWQRNAGPCLPGWDPRLNMLNSVTPLFSVVIFLHVSGY